MTTLPVRREDTRRSLMRGLAYTKVRKAKPMSCRLLSWLAM